MIKMGKTQTEEFYTIYEIAERLKVVYLTVYRWIRSGKLKAYKIQKQYRIKDEDFRLFLENNYTKNKK